MQNLRIYIALRMNRLLMRIGLSATICSMLLIMLLLVIPSACVASIIPSAVEGEVSDTNFLLERVDVHISDIQLDGSAKVHESIKFIITGSYSQALYDVGFEHNDLAFWSTATGLKDVKKHINPTKGAISDFRLRPQPRTSCNPIQGTCHGELILDYYVHPSYNISADGRTKKPMLGTGLFNVEGYKPRTTRYTINPAALSFTTTEQNNIILDDNVYLTIHLPSDSITLDVNPLPTKSDLSLPARVQELSWNDMILVRFLLVFDVERGLDSEVGAFFSDTLMNMVSIINSPHGYAIVLIGIILIGGYVYVGIFKRRTEE